MDNHKSSEIAKEVKKANPRKRQHDEVPTAGSKKTKAASNKASLDTLMCDEGSQGMDNSSNSLRKAFHFGSPQAAATSPSFNLPSASAASFNLVRFSFNPDSIPAGYNQPGVYSSNYSNYNHYSNYNNSFGFGIPSSPSSNLGSIPAATTSFW